MLDLWIFYFKQNQIVYSFADNWLMASDWDQAGLHWIQQSSCQ